MLLKAFEKYNAYFFNKFIMLKFTKNIYIEYFNNYHVLKGNLFYTNVTKLIKLYKLALKMRK